MARRPRERGEEYGAPLPSVDKLPDPRLRSAGNPHLSGHRGGHETNLRALAASGMTLLGRIERADGEHLRLAGDLSANLARADDFFAERFQPLIDTFIENAGVDAPPDDRTPFTFEPPELADIDLDKVGISTASGPAAIGSTTAGSTCRSSTSRGSPGTGAG